jgi:putative sugar O-methyltransferase
MRSSVSEVSPYLDAVTRAVEDSNQFACFKRDSNYREILEHASVEQGLGYLGYIAQNYPHLVMLQDLFRKNDLIGNPETYDYGPSIGRISPSTLRYMKVLGDLSMHFGCLDSLRIVEIGGGYGGQCGIIKSIYRVGSYTILDLPIVLRLQNRYLNALGVDGVTFASLDELTKPLECDLVISNYAVSECIKSVTDEYLRKVILHAPRGYLTNNKISEDAYNMQEWMERLPFAMRLVEMPLTHPLNYILVWKKGSLPVIPCPLEQHYRSLNPV